MLCDISLVFISTESRFFVVKSCHSSERSHKNSNKMSCSFSGCPLGVFKEGDQSVEPHV